MSDEIKVGQDVFVIVSDGVFMHPQFVCRSLDVAAHVVGVLAARGMKDGSLSGYRIIRVAEVA